MLLPKPKAVLRGVLAFMLALLAHEVSAQRIVIDNLPNGQGSHTYTQTGSWAAATSPTGFHGADYSLAEAGAGATTARWRPNITTAGLYKVYLRWSSDPGRSPRVPIEVHYEGGSKTDATRRLNQQVNGGVWVFVGTYFLPAGTGNSVRIRAAEDGSVAADAALFELSHATSTAPDYPAPTTPRAEYDDPNWRLNPSEVLLVRTDTAAPGVAPHFQLRVDGEPFYVKAACGHEAVAPISAAGGNTIRVYSINPLGDVSEYLQAASDAGIKVVVGIYIAKGNREGTRAFYDDPVAVQQQFEQFKVQIDAYKHHEAILAWSIGNEIDPADHPNPEPIYRAIDQFARYIREVDHYHPAMTSHAGSHQSKIAGTTRWAPHIDIIGINSYERTIMNVYPNVLAAGWTGPYMVTEWSIEQPQQRKLAEGNITSFGSVIEQPSAEKFDRLIAIYNNHILSRPDRCIGSFAFKGAMGAFRITHTWYPILDANLRPTPAYDAMRINWGGPPPAITAPKVHTITINDKAPNQSVKVAGSFTSEVTVSADPGAELEYLIEVRPEVAMSVNYPPSPISGLVAVQDPANPRRFTIATSGMVPGRAYRLFYYVRRRDSSDPLGYNAVGSANIPFWVEASGERIAEFLFDDGSFGNSATSNLAAATSIQNAAGATVSSTTFSVFKSNVNNNIPDSLGAALAGNHYLGFSVFPQSGRLDFEQFDFTFGMTNNNGPADPYTGSWALYSSATGFAADQAIASGSFSLPPTTGTSPRWQDPSPVIWLGGIPQLAGVGSPTEFRIYFWDNSAVASSSLIMRFDSVVLSAAPSPVSEFELWQQSVFNTAELLDPEISGPHADPDGDGLPNLLEYALGLNPLAADPPPLQLSASTAKILLTYTRPAGMPGLTYEIERSPDLATWTTLGVTHEQIDLFEALEVWQGSVPHGESSPQFLRLRVTALP